MLSGLWLLWIALATVLADSLVIRVAVDDRQFDRLDSPKVIIEGLETALLDNGALPGDVASDKIYVGQINIQHQQSIVLRVLNVDGTTIGEVEVSVPKASSATYQLKTSEKGVVLDLNAPNMPIREAKAPDDATASLLVQGTERETDSVGEGQSEILFQINAKSRSLQEPIVTLNDRPEWTMLTDDGSVEGDVAGDGMFMGMISLPSRENLGFQVSDSGRVLGNLEALLPSAQGVLIALRYNEFGLSGVSYDENGETGTMVVQATPKGEQIASTSESDKIALTVHLDDRLLQRLKIPALSFVAQKGAGTNFRDDGTNGDTEGEDHLWIASTVLERDEFVQLKVIDEEQEQGQLTVFLPSTSEAVVWLRSTENGIKLVTEPTQGNTSSTTTTVEVSGGTAVTNDRLAHVLWVVLTLFAIAFAYVRTVVSQHWSSEVKPLLNRLHNFLEAQQEGTAQRIKNREESNSLSKGDES